MGTINFTPVTEGTEASAANINSQFSSLAAAGTGLNALDKTSIEREALKDVHLPALSAVDLFTTGYAAIAPVAAATGTLDVYDNHLPLTGGPAFPYTYQTFIANGPVSPNYGPTTVSGELGWAIVAFAGVVADAAEVSLGATTNLNTVGLEGILLRGSVGLRSTGFTAGLGVVSLAIGIGFRDGAGAEHVIERSVRFYSGKAAQLGDCVTSTFLTQADIDVHAAGLVDMFIVIAGAIPDGGFTTTTRALEIGYYNLSAIPLHAGTLV